MGAEVVEIRHGGLVVRCYSWCACGPDPFPDGNHAFYFDFRELDAAVRTFLEIWRPARDGRGPHHMAVHVDGFHVASIRRR